MFLQDAGRVRLAYWRWLNRHDTVEDSSSYCAAYARNRLVLDRPDAGNSVTQAVQRDLIDNLVRVSADPEIRAVVLTAAGTKHFCTGPNLRDPEMRPSQDREAGGAARILRNGSQAVVCAVLDSEKPVICGLKP
jgi:2-(1,2-epoxy-1,2-dihydrophenyl)acetyl-CoA isomerase